MTRVERKTYASLNMEALAQNEYPGRGLILGQSDNGQDVIVYWLMGRSESSRNRKLVISEKDGSVRTEAYDPTKLKNPELLIYNAIREIEINSERCQIVSNGDQTDTIYDYLAIGKSFAEALRTRTYEPDAPNFTPRISGLLIPKPGFSWPEVTLSKISRSGGFDGIPEGEPDYSFYPEGDRSGFGKMLHTYEDNGNPLPAFEGDPRTVLLEGRTDKIGFTYWNLLNPENRVSLVVKAIDRATSKVDWALFNRIGKATSAYFMLDF